MSAAMGFSLGTQERVRDSRGKRAISVRSIEVRLYMCYIASVGSGGDSGRLNFVFLCLALFYDSRDAAFFRILVL